MQEAGADLIDVGAQSTRPGATLVPPEEELRRAAPVVAALVASEALRVPLSVGTNRRLTFSPVLLTLTFHPQPNLHPNPDQVDTNSSVVARELVACGAHCVNDVSGGTHDPQMLPTLAALGVPTVLMHMRGTPDTMASLASYDDVVAEARPTSPPLHPLKHPTLPPFARSPGQIHPLSCPSPTRTRSFSPLLAPARLPASAAATTSHVAHPSSTTRRAQVRAELLARLHAAEDAGLPRWNVISDPGIGFAKTAPHNLALLRELDRFGHDDLGYPMLLGVSRKAFIGKLLDGAPPRERVWGTAAACALGIPHADILRVHDVREMREVAAVADAIARIPS